ncbi:MFS transporter, PPP family, 3-phenylpropionic acid transporter [Paenibacillus catalpae]|uniref:MFS transporter, PPP family, 3-phenylpropionic acid transporter n=1 Tax=Paenibacillus catalpae TaxID=1045775 RepID=A0A1I1X4E1_9BACL|nr:MFS transporter [Paenibacillus catalpae]SFE02229.1 MFS transporter, PPP family, 3-phenylpropionic acid transporter [Paenibacillus catalpae]
MKLYLLRGYNFFYFSMFAMFLSFLPIYFAEKGMTASEIGIILGTGSIIGVVSQPLWGMISDRYKTVKVVLLILLAASICLGMVLFSVSLMPAAFALTAMMYFFLMPADPLTESMNYRIAERAGVSFGSVRMYGALGYAVASYIIGYIGDQYGMGSFAYMYGIYGIVTLLLCAMLPETPATGKPVAWMDMVPFFQDRRTVQFLLLVLLIAIPHRMNDSYVGLYVQSLGGGVGMVGMAWFIMTLVEVAFFALIHRFIKPGKELLVISIAAGFYVLRFALSAWWDHPVAIVGLQLLQGVSFVLFYAASIQYLYTLIPEQWKATGQTILAMLLFGISSIISSTVGGWLFDWIGGPALYACMSALSFIGACCGLLIQRNVSQIKKGIRHPET